MTSFIQDPSVGQGGNTLRRIHLAYLKPDNSDLNLVSNSNHLKLNRLDSNHLECTSLQLSASKMTLADNQARLIRAQQIRLGIITS